VVPPEPESKIHLLARDLVARGHEVTTITGIPNYPSGRVYDGYRVLPWPQIERRDGVRVVRVPLYPDHGHSAIKRVLNYGSFAVAAAIFGPLMSGRADAMWVYHPPLTVALPAWVIAAIRRIPFVYEVQDMWPETLAASGMLRWPPALGLVGRLARFVYRRADRITVISPGFKRNLVAKGVPESKVEVIPNWADEDVYRPVPADASLARELGMEGSSTSFTRATWEPPKAWGTCWMRPHCSAIPPNVQFVLVGDGVQESELQGPRRPGGPCERTLPGSDASGQDPRLGRGVAGPPRPLAS
jgi:glycosyltransferase involved in cell wall biosynthesis